MREIESEALEDKLNLLRSGRRTKTDIIVWLGTLERVGIRAFRYQVLRVDLSFQSKSYSNIGSICKILMLPRFMERVNRFEANYFFNLIIRIVK